MREPDFLVGETWVYQGQALAVDGTRFPMNGVQLRARFYTSQGAILDLTEQDQGVSLNLDQDQDWDYEIVVRPEDQDGFVFEHGRYKLQVSIQTADGQISIDMTKSLYIPKSSFVRWA